METKYCNYCNRLHPKTIEYFYEHKYKTVKGEIRISFRCKAGVAKKDPDTYFIKEIKTHKKCTSCKNIFPLKKEYWVNVKVNGKYYPSGKCRKCLNKMSRKKRASLSAEEKKTILLNNYKWRRDNPDKAREMYKKTYQKNKHKYREIRLKYQRKNRRILSDQYMAILLCKAGNMSYREAMIRPDLLLFKRNIVKITRLNKQFKEQINENS